MSSKSCPKHALDNRANQLNPTHPAYHQSRGASPGQAVDIAAHSDAALDNRANQLNPGSGDAGISQGVSGQPVTNGPGPSEKGSSKSV